MSTEYSTAFNLYLEWVGEVKTFEQAELMLTAFKNNTDLSWNASAWFYHIHDISNPFRHDYEIEMLTKINTIKQRTKNITPKMVRKHCLDVVAKWWMIHEAGEYFQTPLCLILWDDDYVILQRSQYLTEDMPS